jgi:hypothetical protein
MTYVNHRCHGPADLRALLADAEQRCATSPPVAGWSAPNTSKDFEDLRWFPYLPGFSSE